MTTFSIASWGSDSWPGTIAQPWASPAPWNAKLEKAEIGSGDVLLIVGALTFTETLNTPTTPVTIRGIYILQRPKITVSGAIGGIQMATAANGVVIENVEIEGGTNCIAFGTNATNCIVRSCKVSNWTSHGVDGAGGAAMNGNKVQRCEMSGGYGDGFSVGNGSGWTIEHNYIHDTTGDPGTDGIAFHDANAFKNVVRGNLVVNVAPMVGKAGISVGSTGPGGGSWVEADGNVIINCGTRGIACLPVGGSQNPNGRLVARNNFVVTSKADNPGVAGIGVLLTNDAKAPIIENNVVVNRYAYVKGSDDDTGRNPSYELDCSAVSTVQPFFFNNVSILTDAVNQLHWIATGQYFGAAAQFVGADLAQLGGFNCFWPASSIGFLVPGVGALDLASLVSSYGFETGSIEKDPGFVAAVPEAAADFYYSASSPLIGAGANLSARFTTDAFGFERKTPWSIGPIRGVLPTVDEAEAVEVICRSALRTWGG